MKQLRSTMVLMAIATLIAVPSASYSYYASQGSAGDKFIAAVLEGYAGLNDCAVGFRPANLFKYMDAEAVEFKTWLEHHPQEPNSIVHLSEWKDSGVRAVALTQSTMYGPTIRLKEVWVTGSIDKLDLGVDLGANISDFLEMFELPEEVAESRGFHSDKGFLSFDIATDGAVMGITVECVFS